MAEPSTARTAQLRIDSWEHPFTRKLLGELGASLPDYLGARRWFRSKARSMREVAVEDVLEAGAAWILVLQVAYADGGSDRYLVPAAITRGTEFSPPEAIAQIEGPAGESAVLYGALSEASFRDELLQAFARNGAFGGTHGNLVAQRTRAFEESGAGQKLESVLVTAEQTNSSIIYGDRCILKLFRKLEPGLDPDAEVGLFLTARGFRHTPQVLGTLEYRTQAQAYSAGILQRFVKNRGDAWASTLEALKGVFRTDAYAPVPENLHPLDLAQHEPSAQVREVLGPFAAKIRLLGQRTAELHAALCDPAAGPDFAPEVFSPKEAEKAHANMVGQADIAFGLMRRGQPGLSEDVAGSVGELLRHQNHIAECFARFRDFPVSSVRIRHHGDFHLGQVLDTGNDFMIIDFEGEPSRPLEARRGKALALRDVAGMIRSLQYAAYASLFDQFPGAATNKDLFPMLESWAVCWSAWARAFYVDAYFQAADPDFAGASGEERRVVLDAFLLEKVLYEVAYEWNTRPGWLRIPLRGALALIG